MMELNKLYNMDCLEGMGLLDNNSIDLTVTSPPYDNLRAYNGFSFNFESVAKELYRITKQGGVVVWVVGDSTVKGNESGTSFRQALYFKEIGFNLHDTMIYEKAGMSFPDSKRYDQIFEYMFVFSKGTPKTFNPIKDRLNKSNGRKITGTERNPDGSFRSMSGLGNTIGEYGKRFNIWTISNQKRGMENKHPAVFPEKLANDHILSWSNKNDIVLDCFMGSGTTAKMAKLNNRNYIGFESSEEYCEIANKRIKEATDERNLI